VHALPHRLDARRRDARQDHRPGIEPEKNLALVTDLCNTMKFGSLCALGGFTPYPVMSALNHFPEDFGRRRNAASCGIGA
jgi:NADH:ubiquinone oxidoreductase subunit F (NADH-binding)